MANILGWPGVWLGLLFSPEKTVKRLKSNRPGLADGLMSFGLLNFIIGVLGFLFAAVVSVFVSPALSGIAPAWAEGGLLVMLAVFFGLSVIAYPIGMMIGLLVLTAFFKLASVLLKGKSSFGELCGLAGVVGSAYTIVMIALFVIIYVPMICALMLLQGSASAIVILYLLMGVAYLITLPFIQMVTAIFFDMLADIEKVSIYRSGAMNGLALGMIMFLFMLALSLMMFLLGSWMEGYQSSGYGYD
jgi:hypothetical protein